MNAGEQIRKQAILMDKIANRVSDVLALFADTVQARTVEEFLKFGLVNRSNVWSFTQGNLRAIRAAFDQYQSWIAQLWAKVREPCAARRREVPSTFACGQGEEQIGQGDVGTERAVERTHAGR
jgi:hypothetical protein